MIYRKEFSFESTERMRFYVITPYVEQAIEETGTKSGLVLIRTPHTTMRVVLTELAEKGLVQDYIEVMLNTFGEDPRSSWVVGQNYMQRIQEYKHYCMDNPRRLPRQIDDDYNAGRHMRAAVFGEEGVMLGYLNGRLDVGQFEDLGILECDGRDGKGKNPVRNRSFYVWVIPQRVRLLPTQSLQFN